MAWASKLWSSEEPLPRSWAWQSFLLAGHFRWVHNLASVSCKNMKAIREHEAQIACFTSESSGCNPSFMLFKLYWFESHSVESLWSEHHPALTSEELRCGSGSVKLGFRTSVQKDNHSDNKHRGLYSSLRQAAPPQQPCESFSPIFSMSLYTIAGMHVEARDPCWAISHFPPYFSSLFLFTCTRVSVWVDVTCVGMPRDSIRFPSTGVRDSCEVPWCVCWNRKSTSVLHYWAISPACPLHLLRQSQWTWSSLIRLGWLARKPRGSSCLLPPLLPRSRCSALARFYIGP